jgi:putative ABC transport system permease protein
VNVANLLLVRASAREKEIAIRAALGAGRRRLLAKMLAERLVLAVAGGAVGVLLGYLLLEPIRSLGAQSIPRVADVTMNGRVVLFAAAVSCATALLFGIAPAWHASRGGSGEVLNERSSVGPSRGRPVMRNALLVTEVALSFVLLTGAMLLLRSFDKLTHVDPGFDTAHVLAFQVALPPRAYPEDAQRLAFYDQLATGLRAKPGVTSVGLVQTLPLAGSYVLSFDLRGRTSNTPGDTPSANYRVVSPAYFDALRVPLKRGRVFTGLDRAGSQPVAIVDEAFVRKFLPNEEPIGQSVRVGNGSDTFADIVGVVGDVRQQALDSAGDPTIYVPLQQDAFASAWVLVRTNEDPASLIGVARQEVRSLNASLPAYSLSPLEQIVQDTIAPRRFSMLLLTALAGVAVFLAAVGLYGVMAYTVTQRTREIGVRMAMGAAPADVSRMVVGSGMKLTLAGVVLGLALAASLAQVVEKMLFDIEPSDPPSYAVTIVLLVTVAALACYIPARRAMRIDPLLAIRQDAI